MPESKLVVGLSWEPKLPVSAAIANGSAKNSQTEVACSTLWKPSSELVDGLFVPPSVPRKLNKLLRKQVKDRIGGNWFDMPAHTINPELQKDLKLLKLRGAIDQSGTTRRVGTVVESPLDYFSGRLTKKERKASVAAGLLSDRDLAAYRKRKVQEIEEQNRPAGNEKWKIKGRNSRKRAKERRIY